MNIFDEDMQIVKITHERLFDLERFIEFNPELTDSFHISIRSEAKHLGDWNTIKVEDIEQLITNEIAEKEFGK